MVWSSPYACSQPFHSGIDNHVVGFSVNIVYFRGPSTPVLNAPFCVRSSLQIPRHIYASTNLARHANKFSSKLCHHKNRRDQKLVIDLFFYFLRQRLFAQSCRYLTKEAWYQQLALFLMWSMARDVSFTVVMGMN